MKQYEDFIDRQRKIGNPSNIGTIICYNEWFLTIGTVLIIVSSICLKDLIGTDDLVEICLYGGALVFGLLLAFISCRSFNWIRIQADEYERFYQEHKDEYEDDEVQPEVLQEAE